MAACRWTCEESIQGHRVVLYVWYLGRVGVISINVTRGEMGARCVESEVARVKATVICPHWVACSAKKHR